MVPLGNGFRDLSSWELSYLRRGSMDGVMDGSSFFDFLLWRWGWG